MQLSFAEPSNTSALPQIKHNIANRVTESCQLEETKFDKKLMQQDPFQNPFINEIFKLIMAADKL